MVADAIGRQRSLLIVCQKHAALEVVHKRLVAEGLGQRIVMLNDVNRDREPVIRNIREQLEALFADAGGAQGWERQRERLAARIEALEGELDRYHQSLHRVDEATGLSYRRLLGELIELEKGSPPLDFPACASAWRRWTSAAWRAWRKTARRWSASGCRPATKAARWRNCAPSPPTRPPCKPSPTACAPSAKRSARQKALDEHPASFEVDDPTPYRAWLASQVGTLLNLREEQRQRLAHWLPLFRDAAPGQPSRGDGLLAEAEQIERQLRQLDLERHAPLLSALAMLEEKTSNASRPTPARYSRHAPGWPGSTRCACCGACGASCASTARPTTTAAWPPSSAPATWSASGGRCAGNWRRCNRAWGWRQSPPMPVRN